MRSLVHPRRSPRRSWGTSRRGPRRPYGRGFQGRITVWDAMGYHGMTWASINQPVTAHATGPRNLDGQLRGCALKEWLREDWRLLPPGHARIAPRESGPKWLTLLLATDGRFAQGWREPEFSS